MRKAERRSRRPQSGVALLMVISAITILSLVLLEFSSSARTHLQAYKDAPQGPEKAALAETAGRLMAVLEMA